MTELRPAPRCTDRCQRMTDRGLCDWCNRRVAAELAELPELWTALHAELESLSIGGGDGRGGSEPDIGLRVNLLSFLGPAGSPWAAEAIHGIPVCEADQVGVRPLLDVLKSWATTAAEEFGYATRVWTFTVTRKWLVAHHDRICRQPWADDYAAELHEAHRTARGLAGQIEHPNRLPAPCPTCEDRAKQAHVAGLIDDDELQRILSTPTLVRQNGGASIDCESCGRSWREDEYRRLILVLAAEQKAGAVT